VNFARALAPSAPHRDDKLAIAAAFHDLAAFDTLDYLVPSIEAQDAWLQETGRENWSDELALIVAEHHRLSRYGRPGPTRRWWRPFGGATSSTSARADPIRSPEFLRPGSARGFRRRLSSVILSALRADRKLQLPGFLLPSNALVRSGHEGVIAEASLG